mmetsp:Transcript_8233/g.23581  ORF Transcript_8233/g.23581 Transcript_8233/m.23581 type:complete len:287 (+) Transcript_8233:86-946(+)
MSWCRQALAVLGVALLGGLVPQAAAGLLRQSRASQATPRLRREGMLTMRSLHIADTSVEGSRIYLGGRSEFSIGTDAAGRFSIQKGRDPAPVISLDPSNTLHINSRRVQVGGLDIASAGGFLVRGVRQWQMVAREDFSQGTGTGWSEQPVTRCAGVFMLGGYCKFSQTEVNKTFVGLPPHSQLRIVATYHFIDRWIGETGYLKLNIGEGNAPVVVWSEQHTQAASTNGISLCGQSMTPEGKFAVSIDVVVPHSQSAVIMSFGSTMQNADPCDESWGVSGVEVHVRS